MKIVHCDEKNVPPDFDAPTSYVSNDIMYAPYSKLFISVAGLQISEKCYFIIIYFTSPKTPRVINSA